MGADHYGTALARAAAWRDERERHGGHRGLDHLRTIEATLLLLIEPVTAGIWAWLVHGEVPGSAALLGSGLIFAAVVFEAVQGSDDQLTSVGEQTE